MTEFADSFGIYAAMLANGDTALSQQTVLRRWGAFGVGNHSASVIDSGSNVPTPFSVPALYMPFGGQLCKTLSHQTTFTVGFTLSIGQAGGVGGTDLIVLYNDNQPIASLLVNSDGSILVYGNNTQSTVIMTCPAGTLVANTTCFLSFKATVSGTTNMTVAAEVRVNGVSINTGSNTIGRNANTLASGIANFNRIFIQSGVSTNGQAFITGLYITNGNGPTNTGFLETTTPPWLVVVPLVARIDSTPSQWTASGGGAHYLDIITLPIDESGYVSDDNPGDVDAYLWQQVPTFNGTIKSVQLSVAAESTLEGLRTIQGNIGVSQEVMNSFGLASGQFYRHQAFDLDPATGLAWTAPNFNAKKFGLGVVL
jgi:hypothetical protein